MSDRNKLGNPERIDLHGEIFTYLAERRNSTLIYKNLDGGLYLRLGPTPQIQREVRIGTQLIDAKLPVPEIIWQGVVDGQDAYIEKGVGDQPFGEILKQEWETEGRVLEKSFSILYEHASKFAHNVKNIPVTPSWDLAAKRIHVDGLASEKPELSDQIEKLWSLIQKRLEGVPWVYTHGDFNPFNILPGGVIDFEDAFVAPWGYDLATLITNGAWFFDDRSQEYFRLYAFTPDQVQKILELAQEVSGFTPDRTVEILEASAMARGIWACYGMSSFPKLQEARFSFFESVSGDFLAGHSIGDKLWKLSLRADHPKT